MNDSFGLAAFRSRTQVLRMEDALHRAGLSAGVIATPREVAIGCITQDCAISISVNMSILLHLNENGMTIE